MVAQLSRPFDSWDDGLTALCDALSDADREKIVVARLEATAAKITLTPNDIVALALTIPCSARCRSEKASPPPVDPRIADLANRADQGGKLNQILSDILDARDRIDNFVLSAFPEPDPRRLLNDTIFGLPAAALADVSQRLGEADPFARLARRLSLWFKPSQDLSQYGIAWQDGNAVRASVLKLIGRLDEKHATTTGRLLRVWSGEEEIECSPEGIEEIWSVFSELPSDERFGLSGILVAEICASLIEDEA